jgi:hypothetical protein
MTFLEFVCRKVLGPPAYGSMWHCPFHDDSSPSFSVRPPKPGYRVRYKCWGCGAWGDEFDLVKWSHPGEDYDRRLERVAALRAEYEQGHGDDRAGGAGGFPSRGPGSTRPAPEDDPSAIAAAYASLSHGERMKLAAAAAIARERKVSVGGLARYCHDTLEWFAETDRRHFESCDDPACEAIVCRAARGLPPLTREEIAARRRARGLKPVARPPASRNGRPGRRT